MGKWRKRTDRGNKKSKNKNRTNADRDKKRSEWSQKARQAKKGLALQAKHSAAASGSLDPAPPAAPPADWIQAQWVDELAPDPRSLNQIRLDSIQARINRRPGNRHLGPVAKGSVAATIAATVAPKTIADPATKWAAKPKRSLPKPLPKAKAEPFRVHRLRRARVRPAITEPPLEPETPQLFATTDPYQ